MATGLLTAAATAMALIPSPLSLKEALHLTQTKGFDVNIAALGVLVAGGDLSASEAIANPTFNYGQSKSSKVPDNISNKSGWTWGVSDTALFDALTGKRFLRQDQARAAYEAALANKDDAKRIAATACKAVYSQAQLAAATLELQREVARSFATTLKLTEARLTVGAISEIDVARINTARLEAELATENARSQLLQSKAQLAYLMGFKSDPGRPLPLDFVLQDQLESLNPVTIPPEEQLITRAYRQRPDLRGAEAQVRSAEAALSLAKRQRIPDITLSYQYVEIGQGNDAIQPPTSTIGVSAALPIFYQQQGEITHAAQSLELMKTVAEKTKAQLASDVAQSLTAVLSTAKLLEASRLHLIPEAAKTRDLVRITYEKGSASSLEYLDAQRTFIATKQEYLTNLQAYAVALAQLEQASGEELR